MTHQLPSLPFLAADLAPVLSENTLGFHHGKHHQAYVNNLNNLIPGTEFENMSLTDIIRKAPAGPIFNNAAQVFNHTFYFYQFKPAGRQKRPEGALLQSIEKQYENFENLWKLSHRPPQRCSDPMGVAGSGKRRLPGHHKRIKCRLSFDTKSKPLLTCDVWSMPII